MNDSDDPWKRLIEKAKTAPTKEEGEAPPTVSVKTLRETVRSILLALTWRKWSLIAAFLAGTIFVIFYLFLRNDSLSEEPIIRPEPPISPSAP